MSYTPIPATIVTGDVTTGDYWNTYIRDNMQASPAGIATAKGDLFVATGADAAAVLGIGTNNQIVESDSAQTAGVKNSWAYVPIGGIIMWGGLLGSLPSNWQICNGTNGTPDLRNKFVIGAGGSYSAGASGGAATINIQHAHSGSVTDSQAAHTHTQAVTGAGASHAHQIDISSPTGTTVSNVTGSGTTATTTTHAHFQGGSYTPSNAESAHTHTNPDSNSGAAHTHSITLDNQLSATQSVLAPYYALAYIMRLS